MERGWFKIASNFLCRKTARKCMPRILSSLTTTSNSHSLQRNYHKLHKSFSGLQDGSSGFGASSVLQPYPRRTVDSLNILYQSAYSQRNSYVNYNITKLHPWGSHCRHFASSSESGVSQKKGRFRPIHALYLILGVVVGKIVLYVVTKVFRPSGKEAGQPVPRHSSSPFKQVVVYRGFSLPVFTKDNLESIENFQVHDADIFVVSFPKSGTTWVQEVVYLLHSQLDFKTAESLNMEERFPYLEYIYPGIKDISKKEGSRLIKSHMPYSALPAQVRQGKGKVIYISRNPKDVSVSYYHFARMLNEASYKGDFTEFYKDFISNQAPYSPWWKHVEEFWLQRNKGNVLFLTYEDMQRDLTGCIQKMSEFLKIPISDKDTRSIAEHCSFDQMRTNPASNYMWWDDIGIRNKQEAMFMRKGQVGDWKNYYSEEMSHQVEQMCKDKLEPHGLKFSFTLP